MTDDETVLVMSRSGCYHTDEDCIRVTENAREWALEEAEKAGRVECGHCQADVQLGSRQTGEQLATKLHKTDPEDLGLSPGGERASASVWFAAAWLAVVAVCTASVVALYYGGAFA